MLYSCEFLRVGNETNSLNMPFLHFNGQHEQCLTASAGNHCCLTVDFRYFRLIVLWQKALRSQSKASHPIPPNNRTQRGLFDFPTGISPQGHIFGEQVHQGGHITTLRRLEVPAEQLPMGFGRGREAWPMRTQMQLRSAERAATGRFTLVKHGGDLGKVVLEDFAQQEDGSFKRLELL